jgi:hypothetical protein
MHDTGLGSEFSGLGAPAPEVLGCSTATFPAFLEDSCPTPLVVSAPEIFLEKSYASSNLEVAFVPSTIATFVFGGFAGPAIKTGSLLGSFSAFSSFLSGVAVLGVRPAVSALVRSALGGDPPLPPSSAANSGLLGLSAPSPALVGFGPALLDVSGDCPSGTDVLGERLRYSLPVMSESGALIYLLESKSVLRYSWKHKVGKLNKHMLLEALKTFGDPKAHSLLLFRVAIKPMSAPTKDGIVSTPLETRVVSLFFGVASFSQAGRPLLRQKWVSLRSFRSSL